MSDKNKQWQVGIFLFDDVEVLDFAGPFEVLSVTSYDRRDVNRLTPFKVYTFSETGNQIVARNGLKVIPDYSLDNLPQFDILVIPGGLGTRREYKNKKVIQWLIEMRETTPLITSVCTGALLLAEANLLNGKQATTHWGTIERLRNEYPLINVVENVRVVDEGNIITSGGITSGIDMAFHLVKRLLGTEYARETARYMEYDIFIE